MKRLVAQCRLSHHELLMIKTSDVERIVKERLARQLADLLLREMEITEEIDCMDMTKVIRAELLIADRKDARILHETQNFIEHMKEEF